MYHFFKEIVSSNATMPGAEAFEKAYLARLAPHHNFFVKNTIKLGIKATSMSVKDFVDKVCAYETDGENSGQSCSSITDEEAKTRVVLTEIAAYIEEMHSLLSVIDKFYEDKKLD